MLSTAEGRRSAHSARAAADAILVGSDTIRIDDPRLTVREVPAPPRPPIRIVLAGALELPLQARLFQEDGPILVLGVEGRASEAKAAALRERGATVVLLPDDTGGRVSLPAALALVAERGVARLLVEGGSRVLTSFFQARLVEEVELELAPTFLGAPGVPLVGVLDHAPALEDMTVEPLGANVLLRGRVRR